MHFETGPAWRASRYLTLFGVLLAAATGVAPAAQPATARIVTSNPDTCAPSQHRQLFALQGEFPALDAHGIALIVSRSGRNPIALPYDPKHSAVPSFSFAGDAKHGLVVVYDAAQFCTGSGTLSFQLAVGGLMSNVYTIQVQADQSEEN